jgi:hypothetical protein
VDASQDAKAVSAATAYLNNAVAATITAPAPIGNQSALDAALGNLANAGLTS